MARIKLRVWGLHDDVQVIANWYADHPHVISVSPLYKNRPPSKEYRCYIELEIPSPDGTSGKQKRLKDVN